MHPPARNLAWLARHHFGTLRLLSFLMCLGPSLWLGGEWLSQSLGVNPLNRLLHFTGRTALTMLTITLAVTPARRLSVYISQTLQARYGKRVSDWNWLIRLRRQFGLFTFFYACLHLAVYVGLDAGPDWAAVRDDIRERPFIALGFMAFTLLVPLAATSNHAAMKWLGGAWKSLHSLSYAIAVLAIVHFWLQAKVGQLSSWPSALTLGLLLGLRVRPWFRGERTVGAEVRER